MTDDGSQPFVLVFNLADEVFRDIQLPPELPDTNENIGELLHSFSSVYGSVYVYGNSIAYGYEKQYICHDGHGRRHFILWVMKEYGVQGRPNKIWGLRQKFYMGPFYM